MTMDENVVDMGLPLIGEGEHHGPAPLRIYETDYHEKEDDNEYAIDDGEEDEDGDEEENEEGDDDLVDEKQETREGIKSGIGGPNKSKNHAKTANGSNQKLLNGAPKRKKMVKRKGPMLYPNSTTVDEASGAVAMQIRGGHRRSSSGNSIGSDDGGSSSPHHGNSMEAFLDHFSKKSFSESELAQLAQLPTYSHQHQHQHQNHRNPAHTSHGDQVSIPRIAYDRNTSDGFEVEIDEWFDLELCSKLESTRDEFMQFCGSWSQRTLTDKRKLIEELLGSVPEQGSEAMSRSSSSSGNSSGSDMSGNGNKHGKRSLRLLSYIAQGVFGETKCQQDHVCQIKENAKLIWEAKGLPIVWKAVVKAINQYYRLGEGNNDELSLINSAWLSSSNGSGWSEPEMQESAHMSFVHASTTLYILLESLRDNARFQTDLADLNHPPVVSHLINVIGRLRWQGDVKFSHYTQLNLLLWKSMVCVFGDHARLEHVKRYFKERYETAAATSTSRNGTSHDRNSHPHRNHKTTAKDPVPMSASPLEYHAFREDLILKYPSYCPPPSKFPSEFEGDDGATQFLETPRPQHKLQSNSTLPGPYVHLATPSSSPPSSPALSAGQKPSRSIFMTNQSFPFLFPAQDEVPQSIIEAGELFASRVRTTPAIMQLWEERERFMQAERGWIKDEHQQRNGSQDGDEYSSSIPALSLSPTDTKSNRQSKEEKIIDRVDNVYRQSVRQLPSFVHYVSSMLSDCIKTELLPDMPSLSLSSTAASNSAPVSASMLEQLNRARMTEIAMKATVAVLRTMLQWFKTSHILKFEYLSCLLFDNRLYMVVYQFLQLRPPQDHLAKPSLHGAQDQLNFFRACNRVYANASVNTNGNGNLNGNGSIDMKSSDNTNSQVQLSTTYMFTLINMLDVLRKVVKDKTKRIVVVSELPTKILKRALVVYQEDLWRIVLNIVKEQVPFNGKSWRQHNMDLVSAIYLHCRAKLREDWLSGVDVAAELDDSQSQELALRALIKFYNSTRYDVE